MSIRNLANKYRPTHFSTVVDQKVPCTVLSNHINNNNLQPAYLFVGAAGCGKTTLARIIANKVSKSIVEIDGASNNSVDNIRIIIEDAKMAPVDGGRKVYIIDEVHMLSTSAFNALLKILEEPPAHVLFILCTTEMHKVPQTIQSRCMFFKFHPIPADKIYERLLYILEQEHITDYQDDAIRHLAKMANGGMRRGISLLDRLISYNQGITMESLELVGMSSYNTYYQVLLALSDGDITSFIDFISSINMYKIKEDLWQLFGICVDVMIYSTLHSWKNLAIPKTKETVQFLKTVDSKKIDSLLDEVLIPILKDSYQYHDENIRNIVVYTFRKWVKK